MNASRRTLRRHLVRTVAWVSFAAVGALTVLLLFVFHDHVHDQTDALLLQLARQDAVDLVQEAGEPVHVHEVVVSLPSPAGELARTYALVADGCRVVAATHNVTAQAIGPPLCGLDLVAGEHRHLNVEGIGGPELRVAALAALGRDGRPLLFVTGIEHDRIDAALWSTALVAIPSALGVVAVIVLVTWWAVSPVTEGLRRLSEAGEDIVTGRLDWRHDVSAEGFEVTPTAPREVTALASTLNTLLERIRTAFRTQARFIAEASHELRTPLTALTGEMEVTLRRNRSAAEYREALEQAYIDARRLTVLAEHMLQAARAEAERLPTERADMTLIVAGAVERSGASLSSAVVQVVFEPPARPVAVHCHPVSLGQVLDNLLQNAAVHSGANQVSLWLRRGRNAAGRPVVHVHVQDDGAGIPEDLRPFLFQPFQRGSGERGHGLGLYISAELMRHQGGELTLVPGPEGTHWRLAVPAVET